MKEVALKLVRGEHAARGDFVRMFIEEARLASRLGHANVVQVFEFDQVDGRYYIAMELVRGHHLGRVVERARERGVRLGAPARRARRRRGREGARVRAPPRRGRPPARARPPRRLAAQRARLVRGRGEARRLRHRARDGPGGPHARRARSRASSRTWRRSRRAASAVDARADVFALGVVLWELCAGRRLFARDSEAATLGGGARATSRSRRRRRGTRTVPPELDAAILARARARSRAADTRPRRSSRGALAGGAPAGHALARRRGPARLHARGSGPRARRLPPRRSRRASACPSRPSRSRARRGCRRRRGAPRPRRARAGSDGASRPRAPRRRGAAGAADRGGARRGARGRLAGAIGAASGRDEGSRPPPRPRPGRVARRSPLTPSPTGLRAGSRASRRRASGGAESRTTPDPASRADAAVTRGASVAARAAPQPRAVAAPRVAPDRAAPQRPRRSRRVVGTGSPRA